MDERPIFRQGDVLLDGVVSLPRGATVRRIRAESGRHVLARGELTGHLHAVPASAGELLEVTTGGRNVRYLRIRIATQLTHQEHAPIDVTPGLYRVGLQSEYAPVAGPYRVGLQSEDGPIPGARPHRRTVAD